MKEKAQNKQMEKVRFSPPFSPKLTHLVRLTKIIEEKNYQTQEWRGGIIRTLSEIKRIISKGYEDLYPTN